jgi:arrestin-related trafficking adapter 4/5/7
VFGSIVQVNFELAPLLKGLRIGKATSAVVETLQVVVEPKGEIRRVREYVREVASDEYELPEDAETRDVNGVEGYVFSRQIQLPLSLHACIQSAMQKNIVAKHQLKFRVALHNPDGHLSEVSIEEFCWWGTLLTTPATSAPPNSHFHLREYAHQRAK